MKRSRLRFSDAAADDILDQADWYRAQSGTTLAKRWEREVTLATRRIVRNPKSGSLCTFRSEALSGVRRMRIEKFSRHLIFYQTAEGEITILRVLHGARDLEALL